VLKQCAQRFGDRFSLFLPKLPVPRCIELWVLRLAIDAAKPAK
jgi:hypothetical protein